jgi:hypothetical protein
MKALLQLWGRVLVVCLAFLGMFFFLNQVDPDGIFWKVSGMFAVSHLLCKIGGVGYGLFPEEE